MMHRILLAFVIATIGCSDPEPEKLPPPEDFSRATRIEFRPGSIERLEFRIDGYPLFSPTEYDITRESLQLRFRRHYGDHDETHEVPIDLWEVLDTIDHGWRGEVKLRDGHDGYWYTMTYHLDDGCEISGHFHLVTTPDHERIQEIIEPYGRALRKRVLDSEPQEPFPHDF